MKKYSVLLLAALFATACGNQPAQQAPTPADAPGISTTTRANAIDTPRAHENEVTATIMARRSIRRYKDQAVESEKLQKILECGINAPTGMYKQSWQLRVVQNPEFLAAIDEGFTAQRVREGKKGRARAFYGAPCLIFIAYDKDYDLSQVDCGLLGENIILTAQSLGLGTCCLGQVTRFMMSEDAKELLPRLEIPETHELLYAIAIGYADESPAAKPRDMGRVKFID